VLKSREDMCSKNSWPDACKQIKKQTLLDKIPRRSCLMSWAVEKTSTTMIQHVTWGSGSDGYHNGETQVDLEEHSTLI
jgi:hypothetical protein